MENIDAPDVLPVILGGDIGAYSLARAFHEAYGIVPLVLSQADCHMCGDSSILVNRVVPHLERPAVLLSTLANTAECFSDRPLLLLGCGDWYVRLIVENRAVLEKSFIIPYIGEDLLNRLTEKDRFYALCAEASLLLLAWYRGQLGVQSKWFFYVFYPAHLLGLWALGLALN